MEGDRQYNLRERRKLTKKGEDYNEEKEKRQKGGAKEDVFHCEGDFSMEGTEINIPSVRSPRRAKGGSSEEANVDGDSDTSEPQDFQPQVSRDDSYSERLQEDNLQELLDTELPKSTPSNSIGNSTPDQNQRSNNIYNKDKETEPDTLSRILQAIGNLDMKLEQQKEEMKCNLDMKLEQQKEEMKYNLDMKLEQQKEEFDIIKVKLDNHETYFKSQLENQDKIIVKLEQRVEHCESQIAEDKDEIDTRLKNIEVKNNTNCQNIDVIKKQVCNLEYEIKENKDSLLNKIKEVQEETFDTMQRGNKENFINIKLDINELNTKQRIQDKQINEIELKQNNIIEEVKNIKTIPINTSMQITCNGNNRINNNTIPQYNNKSNNPKEFIEKLRAYRVRNNIEYQENQLNYIVDAMLEGHPNKWYKMCAKEIRSWDDFEMRILEKFWNRDIQIGIKRKLEIEKYKLSGNLSRNEYFIERVLLLQQMDPCPNEEEIVQIMVEHYDTHIQDARRVQNIKTIRAFEDLLTRIDIEDRNKIYHRFRRKGNFRTLSC